MNRLFFWIILARLLLIFPLPALYAKELQSCPLARQLYDEAQTLWETDPDAAFSLFRQAQQTFRECGGFEEKEAICFLQMGQIRFDSGEFLAALECYDNAEALVKEHPMAIAVLQASRAGVFVELGEPYEAINLYQQAESELRGMDDNARLAKALQGMGIAYSKIGEYEKALAALQKAQELFDLQDAPSDLAKTLTALGSVYDALGEQAGAQGASYYLKALDLYDRALRIYRENNEREDIGLVLNNIGTTHLNYARTQTNPSRFLYEAAEKYYQQSRQFASQDRSLEAKTRFHLGEAHLARSVFEASVTLLTQAAQFFETARAMQEEQRAQGELWQTFGQLAQTCERRENDADARKYYQQALDTLEAFFAAAGTQDFKISLGNQRAIANIYQSAMAFFMASGRPEDAFFISERARARAFLDQLGALPHFASEAAQNNRILQRKLTEISKALARTSETQRKELQARFDAVNQQHIQEFAEYEKLLHVLPPDLARLQKNLPENIVLLSFFTTPENTYVFVIGNDSFHAETLNLSQTELLKMVDCIRDFGDNSCLKDGYRRLIAPVRSYLNTKKIGIIPHGVLHQLPFAALQRKKMYFGDEFDLFMLPSAASWMYLKPKPFSTRPTLFGMGNGKASQGFSALRGAVRETEEFLAHRRVFDAEIFVSCSEPDCNRHNATESRFKRDAPNSEIIHLAAHGKFDPASRTPSWLLLSPDNKNDGRLEEREVRELDLSKTNLVVLSGCSTQLGTQSRGDEVIGLSRAFLSAGASSVVASLWNVDDLATRDFMNAFYLHLGLTHDKTAALQFAQKTMRSTYKNPRDWAGFALVGAP
ncbi:tetratricopeptide repeat domain protein [Candidatus Moduliflexus flocculans]|uniref:Tetratricopeptide repeat domain protein n=1 Tax=Candidatus Moduliflexus flocculans TaxID=1499966 RepID=A0A0S6VSJ2_9BACT|nr:tetratricopeptide repeat domain protein [Candidatus Moduliflexus flocculans]